MNKDLAYVKLMLEDIFTIADQVTSGNISHNIPTIKCNARKALECLNSLQEEPVSEDLEEAADKYVENWYKEHEMEVKDYPIDIKISKEDFIAGARWQIDKACKWLTKHAIKYYLDGSKFLGTEELVEDFKKAMED